MPIVPDNMEIGQYFKAKELKCKCGCNGLVYDLELIQKLDILREFLGKPVVVNSGYRCISHNTKVGGSKNSQHMLGTAADIKVTGVSPKQLAAIAERIYEKPFGGLGIYSWGIHVDTRTKKERWNE